MRVVEIVRVPNKTGRVFRDKEDENFICCAFNQEIQCNTDCAACYIQKQSGLVDMVHCLRFSSLSGLFAYIG